VQDLSARKGNGDLVAQLAAKYGLEKAQAQRDVDALIKVVRSDADSPTAKPWLPLGLLRSASRVREILRNGHF